MCSWACPAVLLLSCQLGYEKIIAYVRCSLRNDPCCLSLSIRHVISHESVDPFECYFGLCDLDEADHNKSVLVGRYL